MGRNVEFGSREEKLRHWGGVLQEEVSKGGRRGQNSTYREAKEEIPRELVLYPKGWGEGDVSQRFDKAEARIYPE